MTLKKSNNKKVLVRIQKIIADSGLCSRRNAEELITAGRVKVNGKYAEIGQSANPKTDEIAVDDKPLQTQKKRYIMMNKPFGHHTTTQDPFATRTVIDILGKAGIKERLYPVGRLDKNASGLLLLTNDGDWANGIIHPSIGFEKEYHVKTARVISKAQINEIRNGIMLKDGPVQAKVKAVARGFYSITLKAGRHKIVKRIFKYFDIHVTNLKRVRIGPYKLGTLKEGEVQEIKEEIIKQTFKKTHKVNEKRKVGRPKKIFTKKPRYDQREIKTRRGKEKRSTKKVSPKIDKEFTKRKRAEQRNPELKKQRRRRERENKDNKKEFVHSRKVKGKSQKSSSKTEKSPYSDKSKRGAKTFREYSKKPRVIKPFKERSKNPKEKKFKKDKSTIKPRSKSKKFTANTEKRIKAKPFAERDNTDIPRRIQSIKVSKPFNKEKTMRRVGKKKDPMKPKKGAKKRWA
ncbi:hypothetical protein CL619_02865 [archaeon]|nr:hypothetical protein [archaeon]|tara:strand:- start:5990 stop:7366 length:1377 start_codon:yes stop_codon:yes gene_type:complete